jgi:putative transcriptional regulator
MIRFKLKELIAEKEFREGRVITIGEIATAIGLNRSTLSKVANERGYNAGSDVIDRLCTYFDCPVEKLLEYIPTSKIE